MSAQQPKDVFEKEVEILNRAKQLLNTKEHSIEQVKEEYRNLSLEYETLLNDARVMTRVSDRLQVKLNKAYDQLNHKTNLLEETHGKLDYAYKELQKSTEEINQKRIMLQNTVNELTQAKISKRATTITLTAAILLFGVSELFFDPIIDNYYKNESDFFTNIILKMSFALLLKPIDYLIEWYLLQEVRQKNTNNLTAASIEEPVSKETHNLEA